ncbi:taurine dioxygenase [Gracilimonas sp. Q87]|uniref:taurine dioxygenase n=1 Tax=Gracilimonas sp. Q87 TaxID=3384766 RepID=UPI00398457D1
MTDKTTLIDFSSLSEMLYGEEKYISEFSEAAVDSFTEFSSNYRKYLLARDETNFRKAGHKIKPVAQLLGLDQIIDEYEYAKTLLWDEKPDEELEMSAKKINRICNKVVEELKLQIK